MGGNAVNHLYHCCPDNAVLTRFATMTCVTAETEGAWADNQSLLSTEDVLTVV